MKKNFLLKILFVYLFFNINVYAAKTNYFDEGVNLYNKKSFDKSKILFERDIVYNPKNEKSYLYLAKIFNHNEKDDEYEVNLNNVLVLNPTNDEAIYLLILLKVKQSDYKKAKQLITQFNQVCNSFCAKKNEIEEKFNKITPENEKDND